MRLTIFDSRCGNSSGFEIDLDVRLALLREDAQQLILLTREPEDKTNASSPEVVAAEAYEQEISELKHRVLLLEQTVAALQASLLTSMQHELERAKQVCYKYVDEKIKRLSSIQSPISSPASGLRNFLNTISEAEEFEEDEYIDDMTAKAARSDGKLEETKDGGGDDEFVSDFVRTGPPQVLSIEVSSNGGPPTTESITLMTTPPRHRFKSVPRPSSELGPLSPRSPRLTGGPPSPRMTSTASTTTVATSTAAAASVVRETADGVMARTESDDLSVTSSLTTALSVDDDGLVVTDEYESQDWDAGSPENVLLTNFWKACANGPLDRVNAILKEWNINVNSANRTGFTALHQAAHAGHADIVEYLIKNAGANTLAVGGMGWMPLHLAASAGHEEVVQVLLKSMRKFKYSVPDKLGCTPMMIAMRENHQGVVEILKAAGVKK